MTEADKRRRSRRAPTIAVMVVVVLVGAALVAGAVLGIRWWTQPDLFEDDGSSSVLEPKKLKRAAVHVGVTAPSAEEMDDVELTFREADAHFSTNTADAKTTFWVCSGDSVIGVVGGRLEKHCDDPRRLESGTEMTYSSDPGGEYVVATITPTRPGEARLDRVELDYFLGAGQLYRRGTDTIDLDVTVRAE